MKFRLLLLLSCLALTNCNSPQSSISQGDSVQASNLSSTTGSGGLAQAKSSNVTSSHPYCEERLPPITPVATTGSQLSDQRLLINFVHEDFDDTDAEKLVAQGIDANSAPDGTPILYGAMGKCMGDCDPAQWTFPSLKMTEYLIQHGANVEIGDSETNWVWENHGLGAPLVDSLNGNLGTGEFDVARLLLKYGANPNRSNSIGETPLIAASVFGYPNILQDLITAGACVGAKSDDGLTALHYVAMGVHRDAESAKLLIQNGLKVTKDSYGMDPLCYAVDKNMYRPSAYHTTADDPTDLIQVLVENGADVNQKCANSPYIAPGTIWDKASDWVSARGLAILRNAGAKPGP